MLNNVDTAFDVEFLGCVIDKEDDLRVIECDRHFCKFIGLHPSKVKGRLSLYDVLVPQERENFLQKLCKKNSPYVYLDLYLKDNSGNFSFVHCYARNNDENSLCELTFADVSRSKEKQKMLKERAKTFNSLLELVDGGVCLFKVSTDMHFDVVFANEACCRFFGTTKENAMAKSYRFDEVIHPKDKSACYQAIGTAMATKKPIDMDIRIMTHKNEYIWVKWNSNIQRYDTDNCPIFHAIFTDISAIKKAKEEADKQREMLVKMFKNMPGPVFGTPYDNPLTLNIVSEDFVKLIGYTRSELFEQFDGDLTKLMMPNEVERTKKSLDFSNTDKTVVNTTYSIKTKAGGYLVVIDRRRVIELDSGEKSLIGMLTDLSGAKLDGYTDF